MLSTCDTLHPQEGLEYVGVAIKKVGEDQNHVGIIYRTSQGIRLSHLAWHYTLRDEEFRSDYLWAKCGIFIDDAINGQVFAGKMLNIARSGGLIPYGLYSEGNAFSLDGKFRSFPDPSMGLTCATYVIQVFQSFGFPIAELESWDARDDDVVWQQKIMDALAQSIGGTRAGEVAKYFGKVRVRPEEAAAAVIHAPPPITFGAAISMAREIQREIANASLA